MNRITRVLLPLAVAAAAAAGCTSPVAGDPAAAPDTSASETSTEPVDEEPALPPGAEPGFDDFNDDGEPDPTCVRQDYGAGLVVRLLCNYADYAEPPTDDTTLVPNSLFGLPGTDLDTTGISGDARQGRDGDGNRVVVIFITSDTLFATGSAALGDPARANFDAIAALITTQFPGASVQVRGHTDATGSAAANQALSEQRAAVSAEYLAGRGIDPARLTSVGLGPAYPIVLETLPDGSPNETGRQYNRRVEIVVRET